MLHDSAYAGIAISVGLGVSSLVFILCYVGAILVPLIALWRKTKTQREKKLREGSQKYSNADAEEDGVVDATRPPKIASASAQENASADNNEAQTPAAFPHILTRCHRTLSASFLAVSAVFILLFFAVLSGFSVIPPPLAIILGVVFGFVPLCVAFWFVFGVSNGTSASGWGNNNKNIDDESSSVASHAMPSIIFAVNRDGASTTDANLPAASTIVPNQREATTTTKITTTEIIMSKSPPVGPNSGSDSSSKNSNSALQRRSLSATSPLTRTGVGAATATFARSSTAGGGDGKRIDDGSHSVTKNGIEHDMKSQSAEPLDRNSPPTFRQLVSSQLTVKNIKHAFGSFVSAVSRHRVIFAVAVAAPYCVIAFVIFYLSWDMCFCATPVALSSYVTRLASRDRFCPENQHCHFYVMMGQNSSIVRLVSHIRDGEEGEGAVEAAWVDICEVAAPASGQRFPFVNSFDFSEDELVANQMAKFKNVEREINNIPCMEGTRRQSIVRSSLIHYSGGTRGEDNRFVAHTYVDGLDPLRFYKVQSHFVFQNSAQVLSEKQQQLENDKLFDLFSSDAYEGVRQTSRSLIFRTLPSPDDQTTPIHFISGGDYGTKNGQGKALMGQLYEAEDDIHFINIGGDISYSNNMRSCYLRVDRVLLELTAFRSKGNGAAVPLHVFVGNHETGGYERIGNDWDRLHFQQQYFPMFDDDTSFSKVVGQTSTLMPHVTYHRHIVSGLLGMVSLDSGCMIAPRHQEKYLYDSLTLMHDGWTPSSDSDSVVPDGRFVIVTYHNPAFPSLRKFSDPQAEAVRKSFLPIVERFKVPLVLEFHDHVFKRTMPVHVKFGEAGRIELDTNPQEDAKAVNFSYKGTIYVGDGGIGLDRKTPGTRDPASARFQAAFSEASNVQLIRIGADKIAKVITFTNGPAHPQTIIDSVQVGLRSG